VKHAGVISVVMGENAAKYKNKWKYKGRDVEVYVQRSRIM